MADSNRNLTAKVLLLLAKVAEAMGPPFDKSMRQISGPALANFSDNKKQVCEGGRKRRKRGGGLAAAPSQ
jgi:hypothetical protein